MSVALVTGATGQDGSYLVRFRVGGRWGPTIQFSAEGDPITARRSPPAEPFPWVHVDIAGPASTSNPRPSQPKGGTGFAVATIVEYATTKH